ncbi:hypothetical protein H0H87_002519 [Tephrocybe sp. NHM501043]|nr:hypothetical protein H0H87_002519 [Tephrocybe sp. NHM501043]
MAPKNKGKKGKKGDDDFWENAGESVAPNLASAAPADDDYSARPSKGGFSGFAALSLTDSGPVAEEEEEDFGGLMSTLKATASKKKDKKKAKKGGFDPTADLEEAQDGEPVESKGPITATADDLDDEWGPVKEKKKKDKKGKSKKGGKAQEEDEEEKEENAAEQSIPDTPAELETASPAPTKDVAEEADEGGPKILSKKEKEKLKKEREKAKKKAQAAAKKAEAAPAESSTAASEVTIPVAKEEAGDEEEEEATGGKSDSKKKKKKKGKKEEDPAPAASAPAAGGKKKGGISALKALMEEKKRIEEEAKRKQEEELRRIEEEEKRAEEEERKKEEERQRKKEKEKAKKELAKKEGRLLTKKQKEEKQMAEIRKQALLASGVQIEGLQQQAGAGAPKKVVYGNRKKKGPATKDASSKDASPAPESRPRTPEPPKVEAKPVEEERDEWDVSSEDEEPKPAEKDVDIADTKDDWDASSEEEEEEAAKPAPPPQKAQPKAIQPTPKPATKPAPSTKGASAKAAPTKAVPAKAAPAKVAPAKNGAPPAKEEEESDEESSEEEDSDDDSEDDSDEDSSDEESSDEELSVAQKMALQRKAEAAERRKKAHEEALAARNKDDLRSPICCILGHVDTGKTKLLDKIRQTNVQEGEAGGITQQIGATYFPVDAIKTKTLVLNRDGSQEYKIPGLLIIDTPGHESFTNLRSRGSSLCNIAILVVDIMHGLEAQTLESLRLLRDRKTPFIVALNKIDRIYSWDPTPDGAFRESLAKQNKSVQREFEDRVAKTILAFAEEGLNACLYYDNKNFARNVSLVPTSAITGEGVPDMIMLLVNLTQQRLSERLMYLSELECTVLEVKVIEGLGTTIDVVLSNGILREGDKIVVCGLNGPIVTQVRALLTPQPLRELRIKRFIDGGLSQSAYVHHKEVKAALGVKITAPDLEKAIAGSRLLVIGPDDDEDDMKEEIMSDLTTLLNSIDKSGRGVCVQASTLGSLEALLDFLKSSKIPVSGINIGPVHKKDIMRAATMLEKAKELACILCFDVTVDKEAERLADEMGIRLFKADIIYHLFDSFKAYNEEIVEAKRRDAAPQAVWPCRLKIIAAFCKRDPIILGVDILDGSLRVGTPLAVVKTDPTTGKKDIIPLGKITSLEINHKTQDIVKKSQAGAGVAVKIEHAVYQSAKMFGRHFDDKDEILSHISRQSIDVLKESFKADVSMEEWHLIKALKPRFNIQSVLFLGILAGGPAAIWSSYLITIVFMTITAAVLAEICSALPLSGSIYIWAAESAGPKYARFFGFIVAWWSCTAWMTFTAGNCQTTANYIVSQLAVWEIDFPGGISNDNIKWRAFIWALSEAILLVSVAINYLPPRLYSVVFKFSLGLMMLDFFLCLIWLPIGVSRTYGFRTASEVFTQTCTYSFITIPSRILTAS